MYSYKTVLAGANRLVVRLNSIGDPGNEHLAITTNVVTARSTFFEFTGDFTISEAQTSLRTATYINTAEEPNLSNRAIELSLYSENGSLLATEYRTIWIEYVNDHAPDGRNLYEFTIQEELDISSVAEQIIPQDDDKDISPSFTFSFTNSVSIPFSLLPLTGELVVSSRISFEVMASYQFDVSVILVRSMYTCSVLIMFVWLGNDQ